MVFGMKSTIRKCTNCLHIDRETYRSAKVNVCYLIDKKDDEPIAVAVTDRTPICQHWRD